MKILFQGDSVTDAGRTAYKYENLGRGYPNFVAGALLSRHPEKGFKIINRGIGGNRVVDLYQRWKVDCLNLEPDVISILIGVNDTWHESAFKNGVEPARAEKVYRALVEWTREALPAANLKLDYASASIPAGSVKSDDVHVALTGDLSALRASAGYLIPLKLTSSATVDPDNSVVYVVVEVMEQLIKSNPTAADLAGLTLVNERSGWSAKDGDGNPVDDIFGQSSWSGSDANPIIVDLGAEYEIGAIGLGSVYGNYGSYYRVNGATLAYSVDGTSFTGVGVAAASDFVWQNPYQVAVLEVTVKARYIRVSDITANYFYGLNNFNVYVK